MWCLARGKPPVSVGCCYYHCCHDILPRPAILSPTPLLIAPVPPPPPARNTVSSVTEVLLFLTAVRPSRCFLWEATPCVLRLLAGTISGLRRVLVATFLPSL